MAVAINALKNKGVRMDESDFANSDIMRNDQYVVVFVGRAAELFDCLFEGSNNSGATHHLSDGSVRSESGFNRGVESGNLPVLEGSDVVAHEKSDLYNAEDMGGTK